MSSSRPRRVTGLVRAWLGVAVVNLAACATSGLDNIDVPFEPGGASAQLQAPAVGADCNLTPPEPPRWGAGTSQPSASDIVVDTQNELVSAIHTVNSSGGSIYIDGSINVTTNLPTITRNGVGIFSRSGVELRDKKAGDSRASEMLRVTGNDFYMKDVTILGIGNENRGQAHLWPGKRSAVAVLGNRAVFDRVFIRFFTHAAIRLENGTNHEVLRSTLSSQKRTDLGYGVLLRNDARNVLVEGNRFDANSHAVATTGGANQSFTARGNWSTNHEKWHYDAHMGNDGWAGDRIQLINNVSDDSNALVVVRGPMTDGVYVKRNLHGSEAGGIAMLKPDEDFSANGIWFTGGYFYAPFGIDSEKGRAFYSDGEIVNNCVEQDFEEVLADARAN